MNPQELSPPDALLTLVLPAALEDDVLDWLQGQTELVSGFSLLHGQGLGPHTTLTTSLERVQGRARRTLVQLALEQGSAQALVARLRQAWPLAEITYWISPLLAFGRLA